MFEDERAEELEGRYPLNDERKGPVLGYERISQVLVELYGEIEVLDTGFGQFPGGQAKNRDAYLTKSGRC